MKTILITGAAGGVGSELRKRMRSHYRLRLTDIRPVSDLEDGEEFVLADLANADEVERAVAGAYGIVHLGGHSYEQTFDAILDANIRGTYNIYEAARRSRVARVVFPSSNQVVGFYRRDRRPGLDAQIRPSSLYAVSKSFGEALAALYADKHGVRSLVMRIGRSTPKPENARGLSVWLAPDDFFQLVTIGLEHPDLHFEIVYGVSRNTRGWYDNTRAFQLGYKPQHDAEEYLAEAMAGQAQSAADPIADIFMGARLCSLNFDGDLSRSGR